MVQTVSELDTAKLFQKIAACYSYFEGNNDAIRVEKAKQLGKKLNEGEFAIAFCGHFSAGKSSMINKIVGENLLPSSPIPTSANLVKVKVGEEYAKVFFKKGNPKLYPAPYDFETVKSYCKDGDQIHSIEISHSTNILPKEMVILDTPGIDSTDDAHRIATESALHLADLVFYVMDYNHVQSELNFLFTKELTSVGKEVYLVINQIDKHREDELSFVDFQNSVRDSFASWGVNPMRIFYTSLKEENHPYNEFLELTSFIHQAIDNRNEILPTSIFHSLRKLSEEHFAFVSEQDAEALERIESYLAAANLDPDVALKLFKDSKEKVESLQAKAYQEEKYLDTEMRGILKNAYIMPFQTRELAEKYLESVQPDFKVGLLFSKQKTETEKQARLEGFYKDFREKVKTQIDWHLKELFNNILKNNQIHDSALMALVQGFEIDFSEELIAKNVKSGARISGEYVFNYTNDISEAVKRIAREKSEEFKQHYIDLLKMENEEEVNKLQNEINHLSGIVNQLKEKTRMLEKQTALRIKLEQFLSDVDVEEISDELKEKLLTDEDEVEVVFQGEQLLERSHSVPTAKWNIQKSEREELNEGTDPSIATGLLVQKLRLTAQELKSLPGFKKISLELTQKAERLESKGFTVALFGAFSAGKSSFANALIGEKLLPVSPNPTTAAINKIMPVDDAHPHGTVIVNLKDQNTLFEDVTRSLAVFEMNSSSFDESLKFIEKIVENTRDFDANKKTHYAFLTAFSRGFDRYRDHLGESILTDLSEFKDFVAKEEKSCLVEEIKVYFDCELTRKGITLVDTPGADSINARHTGVAFDYIKNSDAILFVTYYNHAFSRADREFLIQLGRVKDSFELDKMFFIVNAIDLAHDEEEMHSVMNYVGDQLIEYGIRNPHLFAVSSLLAIEEKKVQQKIDTSRIREFESEFYSFINNELVLVANSAAELERLRAVQQLQTFITSSHEDKDVKRKKREQLRNEQSMIQKYMGGLSTNLIEKRLSQEINELIFYIKQRVFFRYNDFFKESFNPAVLKDDGRNLKKALQSSLEDFLSNFGFDFAQELRATSIRVEVYINKLIKEVHDSISREAQKINGELHFSSFEPSNMEGLEFQSAFADMDRNVFKKAMSYFKNPKAFFEKNEKKYLSEELEKNLSEPSDQYLQEGTTRLTKHYTNQLDKVYHKQLNNLIEESNDFYQGMIAALSDEISVDQLEEVARRITNL